MKTPTTNSHHELPPQTSPLNEKHYYPVHTTSEKRDEEKEEKMGTANLVLIKLLYLNEYLIYANQL